MPPQQTNWPSLIASELAKPEPTTNFPSPSFITAKERTRLEEDRYLNEQITFNDPSFNLTRPKPVGGKKGELLHLQNLPTSNPPTSNLPTSDHPTSASLYNISQIVIWDGINSLGQPEPRGEAEVPRRRIFEELALRRVWVQLVCDDGRSVWWFSRGTVTRFENPAELCVSLSSLNLQRKYLLTYLRW